MNDLSPWDASARRRAHSRDFYLKWMLRDAKSPFWERPAIGVSLIVCLKFGIVVEETGFSVYLSSFCFIQSSLINYMYKISTFRNSNFILAWINSLFDEKKNLQSDSGSREVNVTFEELSPKRLFVLWDRPGFSRNSFKFKAGCSIYWPPLTSDAKFSHDSSLLDKKTSK